MGPSALSFTYVIGAVALERGVADDERPRRNVDGTAELKTEVDVPPPDMQQKVVRVLLSE